MFVLILTTFVLGQNGSVANSETATISGFTSAAACNKAAGQNSWGNTYVRHSVVCVSLDGK